MDPTGTGTGSDIGVVSDNGTSDFNASLAPAATITLKDGTYCWSNEENAYIMCQTEDPLYNVSIGICCAKQLQKLATLT